MQATVCCAFRFVLFFFFYFRTDDLADDVLQNLSVPSDVRPEHAHRAGGPIGFTGNSQVGLVAQMSCIIPVGRDLEETVEEWSGRSGSFK